MSEARSKFIIYTNPDANEQTASGKPKPIMSNGTLAREIGDAYKFSLWAITEGEGANEVVIGYSGKITPATLDSAARMQKAAAEQIELPPKLNLQMGSIVLFQNDKADKDGVIIEKRPDFYGYSRTAEGVNRHSVWKGTSKDGTTMLRGSTEAWTPRADVDATATAEPEHPAQRAKAKVRQSLTAKR